MHYAYCSNENCNHSKAFGTTNEMFGGEIVEPPKFCTQCGSDMITDCPTCKAKRESMQDKFCPSCGNSYK